VIRLFTILVVIVVLLLSADLTKAGTLDRGVQVGSFFVAGGSPGNPIIKQLKYQMAIDTRLGLKSRYTTIVNYNYNSCTFDSHDNYLDVTNSGSGSVDVDNTFANTYN
jgi:hypothetical protein